ncbi:putative site-specific intron-like DNA endonuclease [Serratia phage 4S]|nr:putative site-specific intron-like DNA endonuclease [Serratia phage 4S]
MNYSKVYFSIIDRAKSRSLSSYTESHHIIPKCMGGNDNKENLVDLTPEEHYVVHQLLIKMYPGHSGLSFAALAMTSGNNRNNKVYRWLRKQHALNISKSEKGKIYYNNGIRCIKLRPGEEVPEGFTKGRGWSPTKGQTGKRKGSDSFSRSDVQAKLAKRRWDKANAILATKLGLNSIDDLPNMVLNHIEAHGSSKAQKILETKGLSRTQFYSIRKKVIT